MPTPTEFTTELGDEEYRITSPTGDEGDFVPYGERACLLIGNDMYSVLIEDPDADTFPAVDKYAFVGPVETVHEEVEVEEGDVEEGDEGDEGDDEEEDDFEEEEAEVEVPDYEDEPEDESAVIVDDGEPGSGDDEIN